MANARGRQNGPLMSWAAVMDGQGPRGGRQAHDQAYRQGGGDGADRGDIGGSGGGYDGGGHIGRIWRGGMAQAEPAGATLLNNSTVVLTTSVMKLAFIYFFLAFFL